MFIVEQMSLYEMKTIFNEKRGEKNVDVFCFSANLS